MAKICMTHSYPLMKDEFNYEPATGEKAIKEYILQCEEDDYGKLIQICDAFTDYGFIIFEKRFVDVTCRYGIMETYIKGKAIMKFDPCEDSSL